MKTSAEAQQITDVREMIQLGRSMEEQSIKDYNVWALECGNNADAASRKVFEELAPRYMERPGGYTRIIRIGTRRGDAAE